MILYWFISFEMVRFCVGRLLPRTQRSDQGGGRGRRVQAIARMDVDADALVISKAYDRRAYAKLLMVRIMRDMLGLAASGRRR